MRKAFSHIWLCNRSRLHFLINEENLICFFISVQGLQFGAWGILPENDGSEKVVYWQNAGQPVPYKDCPFLHAAHTLVLS